MFPVLVVLSIVNQIQMISTKCLYPTVLIVFQIHQALGFGPMIPHKISLCRSSGTGNPQYRGSIVPAAKKVTRDVDEDEKTQVDTLTKASWYAVEVFGKVFGGRNTSTNSEPNTASVPKSVAETIERIKEDNKKEYFLSGTIDELIYDESCTFADPFVSFKGRDRFVENLRNLGSFITEYSARPLEYQVQDNIVSTKFMVKLRLNLPWRPVLAWPWGVTCEIDPATFLITRHEEKWDIEPLDGVKQIFRKPTVSVK